MHLLTDPPPRFVWDAPGDWRGCTLCDHRHLGGVECSHPEAVRSGRTMPVNIARSSGGFCGPEAKHLTFPGLQPLQPFARVAP